MFEYAYRYNDNVAFQYLANFILDFYEKHHLTLNTVAKEMIRTFSSHIDSTNGRFMSQDEIESELKNQSYGYYNADNAYKAICTTFSSINSDHKNTSLLYHALLKDIKKVEGYKDDIGQRFFLSFIIADQSNEPTAFTHMYDNVISFYLRSGIKINENISEFISSWLHKLPTNNEQAVYRIRRLDSYKKLIMENKSACDVN